MNTNRIIALLTGLLTLLLALFSFVLSFNALMDLAEQHGVSIPPLFPFIVEFAVVIFSLNALYRSLHGESAKWQWMLIVGSSLIAGTFNVLHAKSDAVSRTMAAMPSLFLLLSFESFLGQVKHSVKRSIIIKSIEQLTQDVNLRHQELDTLIAQKRQELDGVIQLKQAKIENLNIETEKMNDKIEQYRATLEQLKADVKDTKSVQSSSIEQARQIQAEQSTITIERRRQKLLNILTTEDGVGATALAERLNTSRGTVYSDLRALEQSGGVSKNGSGWEVLG